MFSKLKAALSSVILGIEHDVEAIVANFTSTVKALEARAEKRAADAVKHIEDSIVHNKLGELAKAEADRAKDIAAKIKALVD